MQTFPAVGGLVAHRVIGVGERTARRAGIGDPGHPVAREGERQVIVEARVAIPLEGCDVAVAVIHHAPLRAGQGAR